MAVTPFGFGTPISAFSSPQIPWGLSPINPLAVAPGYAQQFPFQQAQGVQQILQILQSVPQQLQYLVQLQNAQQHQVQQIQQLLQMIAAQIVQFQQQTPYMSWGVSAQTPGMQPGSVM